jgi:hypothetical protein
MLDTGNAQFEEMMTNVGSAVVVVPIAPHMQLLAQGHHVQMQLMHDVVTASLGFWIRCNPWILLMHKK